MGKVEFIGKYKDLQVRKVYFFIYCQWAPILKTQIQLGCVSFHPSHLIVFIVEQGFPVDTFVKFVSLAYSQLTICLICFIDLFVPLIRVNIFRIYVITQTFLVFGQGRGGF